MRALIGLWALVPALAESQREPPSILSASPALVDFGVLAPGQAGSASLVLRNPQGRPVALEEVSLVGDPGFLPVEELPQIPQGGEAAVALGFEAVQPGHYEAVVALASDADCTEPDPILARAFVTAPCLQGLPVEVDFGPLAPGEHADVLLDLAPCDGRPLNLDSAAITGAGFEVVDPLPIAIPAGGVLIRLRATAASDAALDGTLELGAGAAALGSVALWANDCANGDPALCGLPSDPDWVDDDGDGASERGGDCDDADPDVGPTAEEQDNQLDDDCDGRSDEHRDADGDGSPTPADCDDSDPWAAPGLQEVFDGVDNDCNGSVDEAGPSTDTCPPWTDPDASGSGGCGCSSGGGTPGWLLFPLVLGFLRRRP